MNLNLQQLIEKYIEIVKAEKVNSELYKWQAIVHFQQNWDIDAHDFHDMFKKAFSKRSNLMFQNSYGFLNSLSREMPEEARKLFKDLFDENVSIESRILNHRKQSDELLEVLKIKLNKSNFTHQQDERTVSFILTLFAPEKYYLYKENIYKAFCKFLKIDSKQKVGEKYIHFAELADPLLKEISSNQQLLETCPKGFAFDSTKLLFQDILYRVLILSSNDDKLKETLYRISEDVKSNLEELNHPLAIHKWYDNDAKDYRQVALFPDIEIPYMHYEIMMRTNDIAWEFHPEGNKESKEFMIPFVDGYNLNKYSKVSWKHNLPNGKYEKNRYFKIVPASKIKLFRNEEEYPLMIQALTNQFIELYDDTNQRLIHYLSQENEFQQFKNPTMKAPLNQILYGPPGTGKTHFLQNELIPLFQQKGKSQTVEEFESERISKLSWWKVIALILLKEGKLTVPQLKAHKFTKYKLAVSDTDSLNQTMWGQLSSHTVQESTTVEYSSRSKTLIFNKEDENSIWFIEETKKPLLIELTELLKEINDYNPVSNDQENYSFITFHQSYSYEDFIEGIKPNLQEKTDEISEISYSKEKGIFYDACESAAKLAGFLSLKDALENYTKEDRIEKFKNAKSFALFIDEINRGNISAIFGELITLIELDKRIGAKNELTVKLPYSKDKFGVPCNLYIIGTMNTADRSVEALDTALRRRFSFIEMLPKIDKLSDKGDDQKGNVEGINLSELLSLINQRIEVILDRDHTIGHSYFMDVYSLKSLKQVFKNNIIPLLQEYFYGDYRKMEMVIGPKFFVEAKKKQKVEFAVNHSEIEIETGIYEFEDLESENFDMKAALKSLFNKKEPKVEVQ